MSIADAVDRLRQPEYIGANRCAPCTAVNLFIATVIAGVMAVVVPYLGIVAFGCFAGIIYLRGYLVPGTPSLTKRYLPARVLGVFGKQPPIERSFDGTSAESAASKPETNGMDGAVAVAGVVRPTGTGDVGLTPTFRDEWRERIRTVRERSPGTADVRELFDADDVSRHGDQSFVVDGNKSVRWGSNAALIADIAAASVLEERVGDWAAFDRDQRRSVLSGLRLCLDQCPSCDGAVDVTADRADPCCQKPHLMAQSVCENCGAALADAAVVDHGEDESVRHRLLQP